MCSAGLDGLLCRRRSGKPGTVLGNGRESICSAPGEGQGQTSTELERHSQALTLGAGHCASLFSMWPKEEEKARTLQGPLRSGEDV